MEISNSMLIRTERLDKIYPLGPATIKALDNVSLSVAKGEFLGLVGPSGSGKTTLLNIIGSLDSPSSGSALVLGNRIELLSHKESSRLRNDHIGFIFQTFNLLPVYTVYENVEFPLLLLGTPSAQRTKMVMQALEWVGLAGRAKSKPSQLSGSPPGWRRVTPRRLRSWSTPCTRIKWRGETVTRDPTSSVLV